MFDDDLQLRVTELERRLANMIRIGSIGSLSGQTATVEIGDITTAALPWLTQRAGDDRSSWTPSSGEQVVVFSINGDLAQGVILPALYSDAAPAPDDSPTVRRTTYKDGATIAYDTASSALTATLPGTADITTKGDVTVSTQGGLKASAVGDVDISSGATAKISAANIQLVASQGGAGAASMSGSFTLTGDLAVTGNVTATGTILDGSGNSNHHSH